MLLVFCAEFSISFGPVCEYIRHNSTVAFWSIICRMLPSPALAADNICPTNGARMYCLLMLTTGLQQTRLCNIKSLSCLSSRRSSRNTDLSQQAWCTSAIWSRLLFENMRSEHVQQTRFPAVYVNHAAAAMNMLRSWCAQLYAQMTSRRMLILCSFHCTINIYISRSSMSSHSRAKYRDDIMTFMHVYTGADALPSQQDTELQALS